MIIGDYVHNYSSPVTLTWGGHILPLTISLATAQKRHHAVPALLPATQGKQLIRSLNPSIRIFCISAHNFYITIVITVFVYCYCISILLLLFCYSYYLYCHCSISKVLYTLSQYLPILSFLVYVNKYLILTLYKQRIFCKYIDSITSVPILLYVLP